MHMSKGMFSDVEVQLILEIVPLEVRSIFEDNNWFRLSTERNENWIHIIVTYNSGLEGGTNVLYQYIYLHKTRSFFFFFFFVVVGFFLFLF